MTVGGCNGPLKIMNNRIFVLVNTLQGVSSFVYANHIEFFSYCKQHLPEYDLKFFTPHRSSIDNARNWAAKQALDMECDRLLFIDDDVQIHPNTLQLLIEADKDICAGLVIIRGFPFNVMGFRWADNDNGQETHLTYYNDIPLESKCSEGHDKFVLHCKGCLEVPLQKLVKCDAVGFSCCLIKTDVLRALPEPYFVTGKYNTEDVYFCLKTMQLEPRPEIYMHTHVQPGHILNPECIEWRTREKFHKFYEGTVVDLARDKNYIDKCLAAL